MNSMFAANLLIFQLATMGIHTRHALEENINTSIFRGGYRTPNTFSIINVAY